MQKVIAALPGADAIYYRVQRSVGSLRPGRHDPRGWLDASARMARWIGESGRELSGKTVLEVGTGRTVDLPTGLWLCGAGKIMTVDLNCYLSAALTLESLRFLRARPQDAQEAFGDMARRPAFAERFARLVAFDGGLPELLRMMNVEYVAPADATRLQASDASVDYHVSYAVLEHVPREVIRGILREARRVLRPAGMLVHVIDPSDHFSHDDASITTLNFLKFGEREWQRLAGNKFAYHNRLRAHEYLDLFTRAGVHVIRQQQNLDERALRALGDGFPLHESFRHIEPDKLAVRGVTIIASFGPVSPAPRMTHAEQRANGTAAIAGRVTS
jgi:SAM-dependent methyltransferase